MQNILHSRQVLWRDSRNTLLLFEVGGLARTKEVHAQIKCKVWNGRSGFRIRDETPSSVTRCSQFRHHGNNYGGETGRKSRPFALTGLHSKLFFALAHND